jgi:hypothetical protein
MLMSSLIRCGVLTFSALTLLCEAPPSRAEEPNDPEDSGLVISGFVDGFYAYNSNQPDDHANFLPGLGTSAKRDNEFSVNLAEVDFMLAPDPVGAKLTLGFGAAVDVVHAAEVRGIAASPDLWRHVVQASVQWQTEVGRGLLAEAGVYPSHIGFEAFATKDNWNYTRSWLGELSPYYQNGLKLAYPFNESWSGQLHFLNGWQVISDNNRGKTVGVQLARSSDPLSVSFNGILGPELAENDDDIRALFDTVVLVKATSSVSLGASFDIAREGRPVGDDAFWYGVGLYGRLAPVDSRTAFALRAEHYDDEDGAISGFAQTLHEVTVTLEHRPDPRLIFKLEGRYDQSDADVFASDDLDEAGMPVREEDQFLLLFGGVATF